MFFICIDSSDNKVRSPMERPLFFSLPHRAKIKCKTLLLYLINYVSFIRIRKCHIAINCLKIQVTKKYFRISKFFCKKLCVTSWCIYKLAGKFSLVSLLSSWHFSRLWKGHILTLENVYNYVSMTLVTLLNFVENVSEYV